MNYVALFLMTMVSSLSFAGESRQIGTPIGGQVTIINDGIVTCMVFKTGAGWAGGISCDGDVSKIDMTKIGPKIFNVGYSGSVARTMIDGRVCYVYENDRAGGISCLKK